MRIAYQTFVALAACAAIAGPAAQARAPRAAPTIAAFAGKWRVAAVVPSSGVGALARNDPAYMNHVVQVTATRIAWAPGSDAGGGTVDDVCTGPSLRPASADAAQAARRDDPGQLKAAGAARSAPFTVACRSGTWGPAAVGGALLYPIDANTLAMTWYDGGLFRLVRAR